jgi:hypothetical protein
MQTTPRSEYFHERYKNMTPEERESRRMRQRLYNTFPKRKQAMKMTKKRIKEAQKHTLHKDSIAMENPMYIPEFVRPHGTTPSTNKCKTEI